MAPGRGNLARKVVGQVAVLFLFGLGLACGGGGTRSAAGNPAPSASLVQQFDDVWTTFDQHYSYFEYKHVDWPALKAKYRPLAAQAASEDQLVDVVRQMLAELKDQHVYLTNSAGAVTMTYDPKYFVNWDKNVWLQHIRGGGWVQAGANWGYATFSGIPYIAIGAWDTNQVSISGLDAALESFRNAPAIIIDVRMNGGGDDSLAYQFAQRFTDQTRTTEYFQFRNGPNHTDFTALQSRTLSPRGTWQFTRPVYLLIGRQCLSSNESFIAAMRELPNVILVGDTTGGGSGNPGTYQLGGGWTFTVSRWIAYTAGMQVIEGRGIDPGVAVPVTATDLQNGTDPVLDYALAAVGAK